MKNNWGEEVEPHEPAACYPCRGAGVYKLPLGCEGAWDEPGGCEDEDNCDCECHQ